MLQQPIRNLEGTNGFDFDCSCTVRQDGVKKQFTLDSIPVMLKLIQNMSLFCDLVNVAKIVLRYLSLKTFFSGWLMTPSGFFNSNGHMSLFPLMSDVTAYYHPASMGMNPWVD